MKKILISVLALAFIAGGSFAAFPFVGFGLDCTEWDYCDGAFSTGLTIYNPDSSDFVTCGGCIVQYANITLDLYVEMYMIETYACTEYVWHRLGNHSETICFDINGTVASNQALAVSLTRLNEDLNYLYQRSNMFGGGGNIPITWQYRFGNNPESMPTTFPTNPTGSWTCITPGANGNLTFCVPKCNHWFQFRGCFDLPYHVDDGHYGLVIGGCPLPSL